MRRSGYAARPRPGGRGSGTRSGAAVGMAGTLVVHALAAGGMFLAVRPPEPVPPVYAVTLVAAPAVSSPRPAPEAVQRPAEEPPAPVRTTPPADARPTVPAPPRTEQRKEPAPRTQSTQQPAPGERPGTGTDVANIKTPGLEFPYPDYLRNIVTQIFRRWDRPLGPAVLRAEVSFLILEDGSVRDIRFVQPSGNFSFDLSCQGAIEAAGNARAFGRLPDGYEADVLPVSFFFTPRAGQ